MEPIHMKIGRNLNRVRKTRGYSLDKVAELTGVSKAMLAQIERGDTNPTISIIWKIANGLHLSFSALIEEEAPYVSVIDFNHIDALLEEDGHYRSYPLFPFDPKKQFEIYTVEMDPGCVHASEAHNQGVEEFVIVLQGTLEITVDQQNYLLAKDNSIRFSADRPHVYRNCDAGVTRYHALIHYPTV